MIEVVALVLTVAASLLAILPNLMRGRGSKARPELGRVLQQAGRPAHLNRESQPPRSAPAKQGSAGTLLAGFAIVVLAYGGLAAYWYWPELSAHKDVVLFAFGLLLTMIAGMFVQVLSTSLKAGSGLGDVSLSRLLFPLLFAPIVYYPIWLVGSKQADTVFSYYSAFLNGYFWQSVVAAAKQPEVP